ncbi:MAG: DUF2309 family protein, partial [Planctomycetes bacterium]|nr:DUF2309 family protein [Planctomycetota bacterium]
MTHPFEVPHGAALEWQLSETDLLGALHPLVDAERRRAWIAAAERHHPTLAARQRLPRLLATLWGVLVRAADALAAPVPRVAVRRRDQLLASGAEDTDQRVQPVLIRLDAAFLDQGVASWHMPNRELGFLRAVRRLYALPFPAPDPWLRDLAQHFRVQERAGLDAERTSRAALEMLGIEPQLWQGYVRATLLSLRGWAGMMRQFELRPDRAPVEPLPACLADFLAVQLTCDALAARCALRARFGRYANLGDLDAAPVSPPQRDLGTVFEAFVMGQIAPVDIDLLLQPGEANRWLQEVRRFDPSERRRLLHSAFERRLRTVFLDGLAAHAQRPSAAPAPRLQAIFCIDERACSLRRHLEESFPAVETFGYAGFFGVAMAWQGLGEARPRPLCPVHVKPRHDVTERALDHREEQAWRAARRRLGMTTRALFEGRHTLARGAFLSSVLGLGSAVPMVGRCLAPRLSARLLRGISGHRKDPITRLVLEREGDVRDAEGRYLGYSVPEMAEVVEEVLRTVGLTTEFCELVLVAGHGSSSLNNPHGAAYDCGATGGGRGGPNARAFVAMANHAEVRTRLAARGVGIPDDTWFVACCHDTCSGELTWFDEDVMPAARQQAFQCAREAMERASALDAHERCRRFESAPRGRDPDIALR